VFKIPLQDDSNYSFKGSEASCVPPTKENQSQKGILNNQDNLTIPLNDIKKKHFKSTSFLLELIDEHSTLQVVWGW